MFDKLPLNIQLFASEDPLNLDIDDLFKEDDGSQPSDNANPNGATMTQNMTKRINEVRAKTEKETKEALAKELGYDSYEAMKKAKEAEIIKGAGYNAEDLSKVIDPILEERLKNDPRLARLQEYENREREAYIETQLKAINETTGQNLKKSDLPKETLDLWAKGLDLEQAYYATHGKQIVAKAATGSLTHMASTPGQGKVKTRPLTAEEKALYRSINPSITEEELSKKTTEIK